MLLFVLLLDFNCSLWSHFFSFSSSRSALLSQIQGGRTLKKTVTVDKSKPLARSESVREETAAPSSGVASRGPMNLGSLFAGGIPKLKSTQSMKGPSSTAVLPTSSRKLLHSL